MTVDSVQQLARAALDGLVWRQQVTAHNLANQATPAFAPWRVDFESAWRQAAQRDPGLQAGLPAPTVRRESVAGIAVDAELTHAAETSSRYSALVESVDRLLGLQALAIRGE